MPNRLVRTNLRMTIAIVIIIIGFGAAFAGAYALSLTALHNSQATWCTALEILTKHPPKHPIAGHPAESDNYQFYLSLLDIEKRYNCH